MAQYLNKDALVAYIKSSINDIKISQKAGFIKKRDANNRIIFFKSILSFLNTLEVKEVNFETAFAATIDHFDEKNNYGQWPESDLREFAEHFFKLGLNYIKSNKNE